MDIEKLRATAKKLKEAPMFSKAAMADVLLDQVIAKLADQDKQIAALAAAVAGNKNG